MPGSNGAQTPTLTNGGFVVTLAGGGLSIRSESTDTGSNGSMSISAPVSAVPMPGGGDSHGEQHLEHLAPVPGVSSKDFIRLQVTQP